MGYGPPPPYQQPPPAYGPQPVYGPPPPPYGAPPVPPPYQPQPMYGPPVPMMEPVPGWWWILPILFGWLGGVIAWFVWKDRNPPTAKNMLIVGIVLSVVIVLLSFASPACCMMGYF